MGICPLKPKTKYNSLKVTPLKLQQPAKRDINKKYLLQFDHVLGMGQFGKVVMATNVQDPR